MGRLGGLSKPEFERMLRGVFARPLAWKILDGAIALVMWSIAASLLL